MEAARWFPPISDDWPIETQVPGSAMQLLQRQLPELTSGGLADGVPAK